MKQTNKTNNIGECKRCDSNRTKLRLILKKAEEKPERYLTCDDCDNIFSKYGKDARSLYKPLKIKNKCPKCNSKNIQPY